MAVQVHRPGYVATTTSVSATVGGEIPDTRHNQQMAVLQASQERLDTVTATVNALQQTVERLTPAFTNQEHRLMWERFARRGVESAQSLSESDLQNEEKVKELKADSERAINEMIQGIKNVSAETARKMQEIMDKVSDKAKELLKSIYANVVEQKIIVRRIQELKGEVPAVTVDNPRRDNPSGGCC